MWLILQQNQWLSSGIKARTIWSLGEEPRGAKFSEPILEGMPCYECKKKKKEWDFTFKKIFILSREHNNFLETSEHFICHEDFKKVSI